MDHEYAGLSLRFGMFAGRVDGYLGGDYFTNKIREKQWLLTEDMLKEFVQEAKERGVPDGVLYDPRENVIVENFIQTALIMQKRCDKKFGQTNKKKFN